MKIDAHNHFWTYDPQRHSWITPEMAAIQNDFTPDMLGPLLERNGLSGSVAIQVDQTESETDYLIRLASEFPIVKGVVGWVDFRDPDIETRLRYYRQYKKLKGFRHIVQAEAPGFLLDENFIKGVSLLSKFDYTYDLLIYHHQLEEAIQFVSKLPEVKIVLDHIAKPSIKTKEKTKWELNIAGLATFQNVRCKLSGMVTEANWENWQPSDFHPYIDEVLECFGPSRVMYGSDWPVCLVAASYEEQLSIVQGYISKLSFHEQENIMGLNAVKFYNL